MNKKTKVFPIRLYLCIKQKEEFPPYVGTYIPTKSEVSSRRWELSKKWNRSFLRPLAPIREMRAEVSSGSWHIYIKQKEGVSFVRWHIYITNVMRSFLRILEHIYQTREGVSSWRWQLQKKPKQKFPPGVRNYIWNEGTNFFRMLAPITETKAEVSSGRWDLYTQHKEVFPPYIGTYTLN